MRAKARPSTTSTPPGMVGKGRESSGERSETAGSVEGTAARLWHRPEQQFVIVRVMVSTRRNWLRRFSMRTSAYLSQELKDT